MKQYESVTRGVLPLRTYTLIRVDGRAFHQFTRGLKRPFDPALSHAMDQTGLYLCEEMSGVKFGYVQSDEISLLLTDFDGPQTQAWFGGVIQKMASLASSLATVKFNEFNLVPDRKATFDARVWQIPSPTEVENYFIWRQQDASRNSVAMATRSLYSHKEVDRKSVKEQQELMWKKGVNWNDYPVGFKRGRALQKVTAIEEVSYIDKRTGEKRTTSGVERSRWVVVDPPVFTAERAYLQDIIPSLPSFKAKVKV